MKKICCICSSYNRPRLLGQAVAMWQAQTYPLKELVILEDSGIFGNFEIQCSENLRFVSTPNRFPCVAAKRNHLVRNLTDADYIAVWDDDDWYLPWHLEAAVAALDRGEWAQPREALEWDEPGVLGRYWVYGEPVRRRLRRGIDPKQTADAQDCCYGAQWSFHRQAYLDVGGHPEGHGNGEDTAWSGKMFKRFGPSQNTITERHPPSYVYSRAASGSWHGSEMGPGMAYHAKIGAMPKDDPFAFDIELPAGYRDATIPAETKPRKW